MWCTAPRRWKIPCWWRCFLRCGRSICRRNSAFFKVYMKPFLRLSVFLAIAFAIACGAEGCNSKVTAVTPAVTSTVSPVVAATKAATLTSTPTKTEAIPPSVTITSVLTITSSPTFTATPVPTSTFMPVPGLAFLFRKGVSIYRYDLSDWSAEEIQAPLNEKVEDVAISPNRKYVAYVDDVGVKLLDRESGGIITVATSKPLWASLVLFSGDNRYLAYNDAEGLKLFNLFNKTSQRVISHKLSTYDEYRNHYYYPYQWSPDSQRLVAGEATSEGDPNLVIIDLAAESLYDISDCGSNITWSLESTKFLMSVSTGGQRACGERPGIYQVVITGNGFTEKLIYEDERTALAPWDYEYNDASYSPDNKWISFVQICNIYDVKLRSSRLILLNLVTSESKDLDTSEDDITTPVWSADGKRLFYTLHGDKEGRVVSLNIDSGEKVILCSIPNEAILISTLTGSDWLIAGVRNGGEWDSLYLVNSIDGRLVKVSDLDSDWWTQPFLGEDPVQ